jgi:hypothetical protein
MNLLRGILLEDQMWRMMDMLSMQDFGGRLGTNMSPEMTKSNRKLMYDDKSDHRQDAESAAARLLPGMEDAKMEVGLFLVDITSHKPIVSPMLRHGRPLLTF